MAKSDKDLITEIELVSHNLKLDEVQHKLRTLEPPKQDAVSVELTELRAMEENSELTSNEKRYSYYKLRTENLWRNIICKDMTEEEVLEANQRVQEDAEKILQIDPEVNLTR